MKGVRTSGNGFFLRACAALLVFDVRGFCAADPVFELLRHGGDDACFHRDEEVFLGAVVL